MGSFTFKGGIHPYDGKDLSKDKPMKPVKPGENSEMVYPLSQHIGAPAVPVVAKGDRVLKGQLIAEAAGFVSANVHSSVSGTVKMIDTRLTVTGNKSMAIIIENDGLYEEVEYEKPADLEKLSKEEIREAVKKAGVIGMGGAGFPTHVKLTPKDDKDIDYVIVNGAECEPYLTSDYRRMIEEPEKIVEGLKIMLRLFENAKGIIAIEDNKPDCIAKFKELTKNEDRIEVAALKTKYPQGAERMIIYAVTKRKVNSSMLPADAGCVVDNVDTVCAVYSAVAEGKPLMERIVTITGDAVNDPINLIVPTGTNYGDLIQEAGGFKSEPEKIVSGGPMMGFAMYDLNVPVTKASSAVLCMTKDEVKEFEPSACINCGKCVEVCPSGIIPARLADFAQRGNEEMFLKYNGLECCACGCCSFICPAKRQLTQSIKTMRAMALANKKKK